MEINLDDIHVVEENYLEGKGIAAKAVNHHADRDIIIEEIDLDADDDDDGMEQDRKSKFDGGGRN